DEQLRSIKLIHHHGATANLVGQTPAARDADERRFLASPDGEKLSEQQRANRSALLRQIASRFEPYRAFQGKQIDTLDIEGLTHGRTRPAPPRGRSSRQHLNPLYTGAFKHGTAQHVDWTHGTAARGR